MSWASAIYHAIAAANGGGYILSYERDRIATATNVKESTRTTDGSSSSSSSSSNSTSSDIGSQRVAQAHRRKIRIRAQTEEAWLNVQLGDGSIDMKRLVMTARDEGVDVMDLEDQLHIFYRHHRDQQELMERLQSTEDKVRDMGHTNKDDIDVYCEELNSLLQQTKQCLGGYPHSVHHGVDQEAKGKVWREVLSAELVVLEMQMEQRRLDDVRTKLRDTMRFATYEHTLELEDAVQQVRVVIETTFFDINNHFTYPLTHLIHSLTNVLTHPP